MPYVAEVRALAEHMRLPEATCTQAVANAVSLDRSQKAHDSACTECNCRLLLFRGAGRAKDKAQLTIPKNLGKRGEGVLLRVMTPKAALPWLAAAIVIRWTVSEAGGQ